MVLIGLREQNIFKFLEVIIAMDDITVFATETGDLGQSRTIACADL